MNKLTRYVRRLIFWFERPLPREEWMSAFRLGEASGERKAFRETETRPLPVPQKQVTLPISPRDRAKLHELHQLLDRKQTIGPVTFDLVDESWLNSTPVVLEEGPFTEKALALTRLLHSKKRA